MKKGLLTFVVSILLLTPFSSKVWAEEGEITPPEPPVVENMEADEANELIEQYNVEVDEYNAAVDQYNQQVDDNYQQKVEEYNEEVEKAEAHNAAEDEKVEKSQQEMEIIEDKIEADAPGTTIENFTTNPDELPDDWSDTTDDLKTIEVEKSDDPCGETVKIINLHLYLDADEVPGEVFIGGSDLTNDHFSLTQDIKDILVFAEWEVATFDLEDTVTTRSEGIVYKDERIRHDGKNYKVQDYDARFIRNIEDYTQGAWIPSSVIASNANTLDYGYGYDFETGEGKGGETYISQFNAEERTQYYLENGELKEETIEVRTVDKTEPKNILSIFTYIFQRFWDEPTEYEPDYMEMPEEPVKEEYLEKAEKMDLIETGGSVIPDPTPDPVVPDEPTPIVPQNPEPVTPKDPEPDEPIAIEPVIIQSAIIPDLQIPLARYTEPQSNWALFNLICVILTAIIALVAIITMLNREKHYDENNEEYKKILVSKMVSILPAGLSIMIFIMTEDMTLPMVFIDKWSFVMLVILIINACILFITKRDDEQKPKE